MGTRIYIKPKQMDLKNSISFMEKFRFWVNPTFKNLDIESYLLDLDKNMNQFKNRLGCINSDSFNSIFRDFIKKVRSIIDFYAPLRQISRRQNLFELNLG